MKLRSPLSRVLGTGSAKKGTDHWWSQRLTAAALVLLGFWFIVASLTAPGFAYTEMLAWASRPLNAILLLLLSATLVWHSQLGVQVVIEDYVHAPVLKVISLVLNKFVHVFLLAAAVYAIFRLAFGDAQ